MIDKFHKHCSKWSTKSQSHSINRDSWIANSNLVLELTFQVPLGPTQFTNSLVTATKTENQSTANPKTPNMHKRKSRLAESFEQSIKDMTLNKNDTVKVVTLALKKLVFLIACNLNR